MKNFGLIQEGYIKLMQEGLAENNKAKQKIFAKFIKTIKNSPILKKQKNVFNLLEQVNSVDSEFIEMYLTEASNILSDIDNELIVAENIKLLSPLIEHNINLNEIEYDEKNIHESITDFLYLPREPKTFNRIVESKHRIINFQPIVENFIEDNSKVFLPSMINELMVKTFETKYSNLSLLETKLLATIVNNDVNEQKHLFETMLAECKDVVDKMLENDELSDIHEDLESSKEKLSKMNFVSETYLDDMCELIELKELTTL